MGERHERVEVAISRNCLHFLRERYGKRKSAKAVIELAAKDVAAAAAREYLNTKGYTKPDEETEALKVK